MSLAISDLCVAILVMPLALQYELTGTWNLSQNICDLWVSFDVTCCTSSILNLCIISIGNLVLKLYSIILKFWIKFDKKKILGMFNIQLFSVYFDL